MRHVLNRQSQERLPQPIPPKVQFQCMPFQSPAGSPTDRTPLSTRPRGP